MSEDDELVLEARLFATLPGRSLLIDSESEADEYGDFLAGEATEEDEDDEESEDESEGEVWEDRIVFLS